MYIQAFRITKPGGPERATETCTRRGIGISKHGRILSFLPYFSFFLPLNNPLAFTLRMSVSCLNHDDVLKWLESSSVSDVQHPL